MSWRWHGRRCAAALALGLLAACAGTGGEEGDAPALGGYRTYNFAPGIEVELDRLDEPAPEDGDDDDDEAEPAPRSRAAFVAAAADELERRGFRRAGDPDLLVDFSVDEEGTLFVNALDPRRGVVAWEATRSDTKVERDSAEVAMADVFRAFTLQPGDLPAAVVGTETPSVTVRALTALAEEGNRDAQYLLGVVLAGGDGVPADPVAAARWSRLAAEAGHAHARNSLGLMYLNGIGVARDPAEARRWLELAADDGLAEAEYSLGGMYLHGRGVPADPARAATWLARAAERGFAAAQIDLALLHLQGKGVAEDHAQAFRWYQAAAEQGAARAQTRLGMMYELGRGAPVDALSAHVWYTLAVLGGDHGAQDRLERVARQLTPSELEDSERRVNVWIATHGPGC